MGAKAQRLKIRLFVEGVELPCIAVTVQAQPNSPMTASIQIPPLAEATRFLPRSLVHVFFLDFYEAENPQILATNTTEGSTVWETEVERAKNAASGLTEEQKLMDTLSQKYKLLFVGDLMGFQWSKSSTSRSVVLQCADTSNYWDYAIQFNNTSIFGPGIKAMFTGSSVNAFTDILSTPGETATRILMSPSQRYPKLPGMLGGLVHLLETMGGYYYGERKIGGKNIFFTLAELRLRLTQMITVFAGDNTSRKLLGGGYAGLFGRSIGNLGDQASFRKIVSMLSSVIFHEVYGQPCPKFQAGTDGSTTGFTRVKLSDAPSKASGSDMGTFVEIANVATGVVASLSDVMVRLNSYNASVPAYNPPSDSGSSNVSSTGDLFLAVDPRDTNRDSTLKGLLTSLGFVKKQCDMGAGMAKALAKGVNGYAGNAASKYFILASAACGKAISNLKVEFTGNEFTASGSDTVASVGAGISAAESILSVEVRTNTSDKAVPAALKQQIFRPDVWFTSPPRCNVIFPDQYTQVSYQRSFMSEPTRLLLKTNDEFFGEDELFDKFYFAPKALTLKEEKNSLQAILKGDLMDHELFTGVLPVFEKMGEFNIFAARSGQVNGQQPVGLAQRSTNFLYFKYRFAARQLQVTGKFNPYVAAGFPGLIIDKYVDIETVKTHEELLKSLSTSGNPPPAALSLMGTHFLGSFTDLTHQIDQRQGTTMINCSYPRQHDEKSEFLGSVQRDVNVRVDTGKVSVVIETWATVFPPQVGNRGPRFGRITKVTNVTQANKGKIVQLFLGTPIGTSYPFSVTVDMQELASTYGTEFAVDLGVRDDQVVRFDAYEITEEVRKDALIRTDLAPEEYIRPGWYGDCWKADRIDEVYEEFFGIGSINESQQIQNADGKSADQLVDEIKADTEKNGGVPPAFSTSRALALSLPKGATIEQAVAFLVLTYSVVRQAGFDTEQFIKGYTWRPIATMLDMFGSADLQLDQEGKDVITGIEGFHSRAFGPYDDLFGLVTQDVEEIVGIKRGSPVAQHADTRKRKQQAILDYVAQLRLSRALLG